MMTTVVFVEWLLIRAAQTANIQEMTVMQTLFSSCYINDLVFFYFTKKGPLVWGQCSHCFHMHCIMKWINGNQKSNQSCPMCRQCNVSDFSCLKLCFFLTFEFLFSHIIQHGKSKRNNEKAHILYQQIPIKLPHFINNLFYVLSIQLDSFFNFASNSFLVNYKNKQ